MLKPIKDSLPWLVPSVALAAAAFAYTQIGNPFASTTNTQPPLSAELHATSSQSRAAVKSGADPLPAAAEVVARQTVLDQEFAAAQSPVQALVAAAPVTAVTTILPTPVPDAFRTPAREPVAPLPAPVFDPGQFAASDDIRKQCVEDLRKLTDVARVYFPSGGVTAEQSGIEQGNVIGLIAQSCPGVRIRVEGHSDASGDPVANLRLSQRRAEEVIRRIAASGVDTAMFVAEGLGDTRPSGLHGDQPAAYYDRRVEFKVLEDDRRVAARTSFQAAPWAGEACVAELEAAARNTALFYAPRSVSLPASDVNIAMSLAEMASQCPYARLRVIGHHSSDLQAGETAATGRLRAKALMAMLVGRGVPEEQIIIASPSWPGEAVNRSGLPGGRVSFEVIHEDG